MENINTTISHDNISWISTMMIPAWNLTEWCWKNAQNRRNPQIILAFTLAQIEINQYKLIVKSVNINKIIDPHLLIDWPINESYYELYLKTSMCEIASTSKFVSAIFRSAVFCLAVSHTTNQSQVWARLWRVCGVFLW